MRTILMMVVVLMVSGCGTMREAVLAAGQPEYQTQSQVRYQDDRQSERRGYRGPNVIQVTSAVYGAGNRCDATHVMRYACDGRRSCNVAVSNQMCGDPAPGKRKGVTVEYYCSNGGEAKYGSAPETRGIYLSCD